MTINAPPQQVWPWLVQIGQGRAGFWSDSRFWDRAYAVPVVLIWGEAITARNFLRGIKRRAETTRQRD